jgi:hypothetical protein
MNAIGTQFVHPQHGPLTIMSRPNFHDTDQPSSVYVAETPEGTQHYLNENLVDAVVNGKDTEGFIFMAKPRVKRVKTGNTKLDKAAKVISELTGTDVSNTAIIKAIADKCRVSKGTAGTYFYKLRAA